MVKGQKQLSQAEVWDDSALVKSWDDALLEYKVCLQIFSHRLSNMWASSIIVYMHVGNELKMS